MAVQPSFTSLGGGSGVLAAARLWEDAALVGAAVVLTAEDAGATPVPVPRTQGPGSRPPEAGVAGWSSHRRAHVSVGSPSAHGWPVETGNVVLSAATASRRCHSPWRFHADPVCSGSPGPRLPQPTRFQKGPKQQRVHGVRFDLHVTDACAHGRGLCAGALPGGPVPVTAPVSLLPPPRALGRAQGLLSLASQSARVFF